MQVWTYPEKRMERFGAERWTVEWYTLRPGAPDEDWDPHADLAVHHHYAKSPLAAATKAKAVAGKSIFGVAMIQREVVDWYVKEDRIAEWVAVGNAEEIQG